MLPEYVKKPAFLLIYYSIKKNIINSAGVNFMKIYIFLNFYKVFLPHFARDKTGGKGLRSDVILQGGNNLPP